MVRGSDTNGAAANFVETEQIVEVDDGTCESRRWTAFLQVGELASDGGGVLTPLLAVARLDSSLVVAEAEPPLDAAAGKIASSVRP